jgi:hypothetical protein
MIIKELKTLDLKVGDKLKEYTRPPEVYTVDKATPNGFVALTSLVILGIPVVISYDVFGMPLSLYSIEEKIKLAYTNKQSRLIPI